MKTKTATPENQSSRFNQNRVHHNINLMIQSASRVNTDFTSEDQIGYAGFTTPNWVGGILSPMSKRRTSATITAGAFFSSVDPMAGGWGQLSSWPVSFCTGTENPQPIRLPFCFSADEAVNPKQLENRNHA